MCPPDVTWLLNTIIEQYVIKCSSKNEYQGDMCYKDIGLCAQNTISTLNSILNRIRGTYMTTNEHENLHFG